MSTDGSRHESGSGSGGRDDHESSGHRTARSAALLGPVLFAVIGAVLIILAIVLI